MFLRDVMKNQVVIDTDWALSLGYKLSFSAVGSKFINKQYRISKAEAIQTYGKRVRYQAMAAKWDNQRWYHILVSDYEKSPIRFIELVTHEVSHVVDYYFDNAGITQVDTELRAYTIDWIVGSILRKCTVLPTIIDGKKQKKAKVFQNKG